MKKIYRNLLNFLFVIAFVALFQINTNNNKINNLDVEKIEAIALAYGEGGGSTKMDCFAGDEIGTQRFPECRYGCPYANMGDPRKVGGCDHSW